MEEAKPSPRLQEASSGLPRRLHLEPLLQEEDCSNQQQQEGDQSLVKPSSSPNSQDLGAEEEASLAKSNKAKEEYLDSLQLSQALAQDHHGVLNHRLLQ